MFVHIFSFRWKETAGEGDKANALVAIRRFGDVIPGLRSVLVGDNVSPNSPEYGTTGVMVFQSLQHFEAYVVHPDHLALLDWLKPLIEAVEFDFETSEAAPA